MRAIPWIILFVSVVVVSAPSPTAALDKTAAPAQAASLREEILRTAEAKLQNGDEALIRQALAALSELGGDAAADAVVARLRRGLPPQLIEAAIDTLVLLNRPSLAPPLLELTQHRRIQIRIKAMQALAALRMRSAQSALLYALDDPSSEVRGAAVEALAVVGNARALPALLTAAEREVPGAWQAIGSIATPADVKALLARARASDLISVRPAFDALLARTKLPLAAKLRVIQHVTGLDSPIARACLVDWLAVYQAEADRRLRGALFDGVARFDREHPHWKLASTESDSPAPGQALASTGEVR